MLVLTRKTGESIHIGDDIVLKVSEISGNRVKICIDASRVLRILRGEIAEQMELDSVEETLVVSKTSRRVQSGTHTGMTAIAK